MSWFVDPELLIIQVESHPLIYTKELPDYSNKLLKTQAWEEISKKLSEDWNTLTKEEKNSRCREVQVKWKNLRDNFRRECQYQAQVDVMNQSARKRKKYRYFDQLSFLAPHIKDDQNPISYSSTQNVRDKDSLSTPTAGHPAPHTDDRTSDSCSSITQHNIIVKDEDTLVMWSDRKSPTEPACEPQAEYGQTSENYSSQYVSVKDMDSLLPSAGRNSSAEPTTCCDVTENPKKKGKTPSFEDQVLKALRNEILDTDEDRTFCLSLVQSLKKMDDDNKILAKIEILKVIRTFSNRSNQT